MKLPYCELNEIKTFSEEISQIHQQCFQNCNTWKTRNIGSLFPLKNKNDYKLCVICKIAYSCHSGCIGETKRNAEVRWNVHNNSPKPSKHLQSNINHCFTWTVISNVPKNAKIRKNLEASYTALWKPDLITQKDFETFSFI